MAQMLARSGLLILVLTVLDVAGPQAQGLRRLTASTQGQPPTATSICGQPVPPPSFLPPVVSGPVVYLIAPCFERQGGRPRLQPEAYLQDIHLSPSRPSQGVWTPYDATAEKMILEDFQRLWNNKSLADLSIDIRDYAFSNGVVGKVVVYNMTERD